MMTSLPPFPRFTTAARLILQCPRVLNPFVCGGNIRQPDLTWSEIRRSDRLSPTPQPSDSRSPRALNNEPSSTTDIAHLIKRRRLTECCVREPLTSIYSLLFPIFVAPFLHYEFF